MLIVPEIWKNYIAWMPVLERGWEICWIVRRNVLVLYMQDRCRLSQHLALVWQKHSLRYAVPNRKVSSRTVCLGRYFLCRMSKARFDIRFVIQLSSLIPLSTRHLITSLTRRSCFFLSMCLAKPEHICFSLQVTRQLDVGADWTGSSLQVDLWLRHA